MSVKLVSYDEMCQYRKRMLGHRRRLFDTIYDSLSLYAKAERVAIRKLTDDGSAFLLREVRTGDYDWKMEVRAILTHLACTLDKTLALHHALRSAQRDYMQRQEEDFLGNGGSSHAHRALQGILYHEIGAILRLFHGDTVAQRSATWMLPIVLDTAAEWRELTDRLYALL